MKTTILLISLSLPSFAADATAIPEAANLTASTVIDQLMKHDDQRQAALSGYTAMRRYTLDNKSRHASMLVRTLVQMDGTKLFEIVEESGSGSIRKYVFRKILDEETESSRPKFRDRSRVTPQNYSFRLAGMETVEGRPAYVVELTPKLESKYLIAGRIWVDAAEYVMVRVEGKPAKSPSFWTRSVHFVHTYGKTGMFWFPSLNRSVTEALIFGKTDMTIEYFDYAPRIQTASWQRPPGQ